MSTSAARRHRRINMANVRRTRRKVARRENARARAVKATHQWLSMLAEDPELAKRMGVGEIERSEVRSSEL